MEVEQALVLVALWGQIPAHTQIQVTEHTFTTATLVADPTTVVGMDKER